jgi:hypothetical protein
MANETTNYDTIFGKMAVEQGLCTGEELKRCVEEVEVQRKTNPVMLPDWMVKKGFVTSSP